MRAMLTNRDLVRMQSTWAVASLGNWAFSILLAVYAYRDGGAGAVAVTLVVRLLPAGLAAPYAALLADRHPRRSILLWSAVLRAVALAAAAVTAAVGAPFGVVLLCATIYTVVHTAHRPAQAALMPKLARTPAELATANVAWSAIDYAGFLLGSLLAGVLVSLTGLGAGFGACAVAFAVVAVLVRGLPRDARPPPLEGSPGGLSELGEGLRTVRAHAEMRVLMAIRGVNILVIGVFDVLVVVMAIELVGLGESGAGWLNAAWGVGGVLGGAVGLALLGSGRLARGLIAGLVLAGLGFFLAGAWPEPASAVAALVAMGVGLSVVEAALLTLTQRLAPDDVLGRVFGVEETMQAALLGLGAVVAAGLVAALDIQGAVLVSAAVLPLLALVVARRAAGWEAGARVPERAFALIRDLPLFAPLPVATLENIALRVGRRSYDDGDALVVQGEAGSTFFVVDEGRVDVDVDGVPRNSLGPGEFFGEMALLRDAPRSATVTAAGPVSVLAIEREHFLAGVGGHPRSTQEAETVVRARLAADALAGSDDATGSEHQPPGAQGSPA